MNYNKIMLAALAGVIAPSVVSAITIPMPITANGYGGALLTFTPGGHISISPVTTPRTSAPIGSYNLSAQVVGGYSYGNLVGSWDFTTAGIVTATATTTLSFDGSVVTSSLSSLSSTDTSDNPTFHYIDYTVNPAHTKGSGSMSAQFIPNWLDVSYSGLPADNPSFNELAKYGKVTVSLDFLANSPGPLSLTDLYNMNSQWTSWSLSLDNTQKTPDAGASLALLGVALGSLTMVVRRKR